MKRTLRLLAAALMLTAALSVGAAAADFEPVAQELSTIGMFRGTGSGFELDRAPTRAEAAIMLVRLYGAEDSAAADYAAGAISHPFTDVPAYAAPHVAWLYTEGLTKGVSADRFGSAELCTAQSYATFLLRALGYADGVDFAYADALVFAEQKGFYAPTMFPGDFLRDDLAALTYQALAADTSKGDTYLLKTLVDSGAVDKNAAQPMMEKMELYREISVLEQPVDDEAAELSMVMEIAEAFTADGTGITIESYGSTMGSLKTIVHGDSAEASYLMSSYVDDPYAGESNMDMAIWMKDGWVYQYASDGAESQAVKYPVENEETVLEELALPTIDSMNVTGLALVKSITREKDGSDTIYTVTIGENLGGLVGNAGQLMPPVPEGDGMASFSSNIAESTLVYMTDRRGELKGMGIFLSPSTTMEIHGAKSTRYYHISLSIVVEATGKDVKIEYPDFSYFVEVDPALLEIPTE